MAGHWPSYFFWRVYGPRQGQYPAILTEQAWSIKDLLYGFQEILLAGHGG